MTSTKLLITVLGIALPAFPQWTNTIAMRGGVPGAAYDISGLENINMLNGNLFLKIPITALPGGHGGSSLDLNLIYNSTLFDEAHSLDGAGYTTDALVPGFFNGWNYGFRYDIGQETQGADVPGGNCAPVAGFSDPAHWQLAPTRIRALFPDGSTHILYPASNLGEDASGGGGWTEIDPGGNPSQCAHDQGSATSLSGPITYYTRDATYVRVVFYPINGSAPDPSWFNRSWTMYFPDGRQVQSTPTATVNETILDRNGNKISISNSDPCYGTGTSCPIATISDSFSRTITIHYRNPTNLATETITQNGYGGNQLVWTITYITVGRAGFSYTCSLNPDAIPCPIGPQPAISELDLPGFTTTLSYLFQYSDPATSEDARLTGVTLPYGAQANYQYSSSTPPIGAFGNLMNNPLYKKTLTHQDIITSSPITDTWTYGIVYGSGSSTVTGPDGGMTTQLYSDLFTGATPNGSGAFSGTAAAGFTYATINPDGSRDEKLWAANLTAGPSVELGNPFVQAEIHSVSTSGNPVNSAFHYHTYDFNGNLLQTRQSAWYGSYCGLSCFNSGFTAVRTTTNTYWVDASLTANQYNSLSAACPAQTACLLDAVKSTQVAETALQTYAEFVYDSPTSTGNLQNEWHWDNTRPTPNSPFPGQAPTGSSALNLTLNTTNAVLTSRTYSNGDLLTETDPRSISIKRQYLYNNSSHPYPTDLYEAFGTTVQRHWQFGWDPSSGLRTSEQDADNDPGGAALTTANYDVRGRIVEVNQSGLRSTATSYNDLPTVRTVTTKTDLATVGDGSIQTVKTMDQLGRLAEVQQTDDNGGWIETDYSQQTPASGGFTYQLASNPFRIRTSDTTMGWTVTKLDSIGRPTSVTHYIGPNLPTPWGTGAGANTTTTGSVSTQYNGITTTVTDEANKARASTVDSLGRLVQVIEDPNGTPLTTTYNYGLDDLMGVLQSGQSRTFGYTSLNRLSSAQNPESGNITYTYDAEGNLSSRTDARNISTNMQYDSLNRIISKSYADGITPAVTYCYDGQTYSATLNGCTTGSGTAPNIGRLTDEYSSASETILAYDILGEVLSSTQKTNSVTYPAFGYLYNRAGSLKQQTYPSGRIVNYSFNTGGRVSQVSGTFNTSSTTYASSISYAPQFGLSGLTLGNNLTEAYSYNGRLQNTQIVAGSFLTLTNCFDSYQAIVGSPCASVTNLTTANNGNLMDEIINGSSVITQTFTYGDGENRLTHFQETGGSQANQTYNYDVFGNRWLNLGDFIPYQGQTPTSNVFLGNHWGWSTGMNCTSQTSDVQYDCSGNQTKLVAEGRTFTYDAENRQITATVGTVGTGYAYDGEGRRVTKTANGVTTTYVYDAAGNLAAEYNGPTPTTTGTIYLTPDHLGSTRLISNGVIINTVMTPQVVERIDYAPFGEELGQGIDGRGTQYSNNSYPTATLDSATEKFTAKERDAETGLDFFGARYFSSAQGRFTSPDQPFADQHPEDPQSWNMYGYVRNNPLKNVDPDGRACYSLGSCFDTALGTVGGVVNAFSSGIINAPNRILDTAIAAVAPSSSFRFGDAVPDAFVPTNADQREGMQAAYGVLLGAGLAEGVAGALPAATETGAGVPQITQNAARGAASESRVLNDMGLTKNTTPITGTAGKSIPDINTSTVVGDVKDVKVVSNTPQMKIQREVAGQTGREHVIVTGTNTHVTKPTQQPPTRIIRRDDLGPQQ